MLVKVFPTLLLFLHFRRARSGRLNYFSCILVDFIFWFTTSWGVLATIIIFLQVLLIQVKIEDLLNLSLLLVIHFYIHSSDSTEFQLVSACHWNCFFYLVKWHDYLSSTKNKLGLHNGKSPKPDQNSTYYFF